MGSPLKLLLCGDVNGQFRKLFDRVATVNKKSGPFEMLVCVGDFFGSGSSEWEAYMSGASKVPLLTYILGPTPGGAVDEKIAATDGNLCENVVHLGTRGVFTGASGLKVAYFSGVQSSDGKSTKTAFTKKDALDFLLPIMESTGQRGVDLFLSSQWPKDISKYAHTAPEHDNGEKSDVIALLAYFLRPRYHFTSSPDTYYERLPYRNHKVLREPARHATRFISLASVGNTSKAKWLYAFSIVPMADLSNAELVKQPADITECPFQFTEEDLKLEKAKQFFYDLAPGPEKGKKRSRDGGEPRQKRPPPEPKGPCWFCLASPEVEKQLVISIGESCYLALAKGALTPDHVLILPIGHHQSTVEVDEDTLEEINKFKDCLRGYYKSVGKCPVYFERNYRSSHLQIQVVPVAKTLMPGLMSVLVDYGKSVGVDLDEIPQNSNLRQIMDPGRPYFYMEFQGVRLLHRIRKQFPLQFGREVLACEEVLNLPHMADWRNCSATKEEEVSTVAAFRDQFKPYDFTLV